MDPLNIKHLDASESAFLTKELTHIRSTLYEVLFPELKARKFMSIDTSVPAGAKSFEYKVMERSGDILVGGDYSNTAPRADVVLSEVNQKIRPVIAAYGYSRDEVLASMMTGRSLDSMKGMAARKAIEEGLDRILLLGDSNWSIPGLFTASGTATESPGTGAGGDTWALKTPDEILADLFALENKIDVDSKGAYKATAMILADARYNLIKKTRLGDGSDRTILSYFLDNSDSIKSVDKSHYLTSAPNSEWTGVRAIAYQRDELVLQGVISEEFNQLAPQEVGFETLVNCSARVGGLELRHPKAVCYMDNF